MSRFIQPREVPSRFTFPSLSLGAGGEERKSDGLQSIHPNSRKWVRPSQANELDWAPPSDIVHGLNVLHRHPNPECDRSTFTIRHED